MIAYADTGFLVSLYGQDAHSGTATALVKSQPIFILTAFGEAEFTNALELRVFRKEWTRREARSVRDLFLQHQAAGVFRPAPLAAEVWEKTVALARRHSSKFGTRTLDIVHVASALTLRPEVFYSFDRRQRKLAKAERLRVLPS
ncbi:MAG: type II toxin-antitoxin system VapC family toxin [Candidatus Acidiferrales bacterium]